MNSKYNKSIVQDMLSGVYDRLVTSFGEKGAYCVVFFFFLKEVRVCFIE